MPKSYYIIISEPGNLFYVEHSRKILIKSLWYQIFLAFQVFSSLEIPYICSIILIWKWPYLHHNERCEVILFSEHSKVEENCFHFYHDFWDMNILLISEVANSQVREAVKNLGGINEKLKRIPPPHIFNVLDFPLDAWTW